MGKKRVKCANCGMVYDILLGTCTPEHLAAGNCPKCGSNAFDVIPVQWTSNYYGGPKTTGE